MPPKAAGTDARSADYGKFLAEAFLSMENQPQINWQKLADRLGMAKGSVQNKFRAITKYYEESGEGFPGVAAVGAPSARSNGKRKSATVKSETENDEEESIGGKPSVKKAKTTGNGTTPKKAAAKKELEVEGVEMKKEEEEDA